MIDTGFAIRNNNDHAPSFDGRMLAISDESQDEGRSTVYTLPTAGGTPRRITPKTRRGWSPDGSGRSLYWAAAMASFDIYKIASDAAGRKCA